MTTPEQKHLINYPIDGFQVAVGNVTDIDALKTAHALFEKLSTTVSSRIKEIERHKRGSKPCKMAGKNNADDATINRNLWRIFHQVSLCFIGRVADIEKNKPIDDATAADVSVDELFARLELLEIKNFGKIHGS